MIPLFAQGQRIKKSLLRTTRVRESKNVIPANAGIQWRLQTGNDFNQCRESDKIGQNFPEYVFVPLFYAHWIPAFAGMTFIAVTIPTVEAKGRNLLR